MVVKHYNSTQVAVVKHYTSTLVTIAQNYTSTQVAMAKLYNTTPVLRLPWCNTITTHGSDGVSEVDLQAAHGSDDGDDGLDGVAVDHCLVLLTLLF